MVKETNYLLSEREDGIRYLVGGNYLYLSGEIYQLEDIEPYIRGKRGVYILLGKGIYYVGEGLVYDRLKRHKTYKDWVEEVYIVVSGGQLNMGKEESLQFEGSLNTYIERNTNLKKDNKDKTRQDGYIIDQHLKRLKWLGIDLPVIESHRIVKKDGHIMEVKKKANLRYKIINVEGSLKWLEGYVFESLGDIRKIVEALDEEVDGVWR